MPSAWHSRSVNCLSLPLSSLLSLTGQALCNA